jgi:hypothetical protein
MWNSARRAKSWDSDWATARRLSGQTKTASPLLLDCPGHPRATAGGWWDEGDRYVGDRTFDVPSGTDIALFSGNTGRGFDCPLGAGLLLGVSLSASTRQMEALRLE